MQNGKCKNCDPYSRAQGVQGLECKADSCTGIQILLEDGKCSDCPDHSRATTNGRVCMPENCNPQ